MNIRNSTCIKDKNGELRRCLLADYRRHLTHAARAINLGIAESIAGELKKTPAIFMLPRKRIFC